MTEFHVIKFNYLDNIIQNFIDNYIIFYIDL